MQTSHKVVSSTKPKNALNCFMACCIVQNSLNYVLPSHTCIHLVPSLLKWKMYRKLQYFGSSLSLTFFFHFRHTDRMYSEGGADFQFFILSCPLPCKSWLSAEKKAAYERRTLTKKFLFFLSLSLTHSLTLWLVSRAQVIFSFFLISQSFNRAC